MIFGISFAIFYDLEPGIDQIRHISWAQSLSESDHLIDFELLKKNNSIIINDKNGLLFNLLKTGYQDIGHLFNIFPILLLSVLNLTNFSPVTIFNFTSIFFFAANTILGLLIFNKIDHNYTFEKSRRIFNFLLLISLVPSFLFYYSSLGIHNISLFFFLLTFFIIFDYNDNNYKYKFIFLFLFSTLGIYSHKINLILIPSLITFYLISFRNYKDVLKYLLLKLIVFFPIIIIFLFAPETIKATKQFSDLNFTFIALIKNLTAWPININKSLGPITLIFFIFGMLDLAKNLKINRAIFIIILFHILFYIFINSFSTFYIRTNLYITHIVIIVSFIGFVKLYKTRIFNIKYIAIFLYLTHLTWNILPIIDFQQKKYLNKDFDEYFLNNKKIQNSLIEIVELIDDEKIIYLDDRTKDYFMVYHKQKSKNNSLDINTLRNLISKRLKIDDFNLNKLQNSNIFLITIETDPNTVKNLLAILNKKYKKSSTDCKIHFQNIYMKENISSRKEYIWLDKISCH
tara:strand:- start:5460 stop:7004 length:1545 start_codon:yes stop_codon:yes gene_type:complete